MLSELLSILLALSAQQEPKDPSRSEAKAQPPISAVELMQYTTIEPEKGTDLVVINLQGKKTNDLVHLANLYATETVDFTKDIQLKAPKEAIAVEVQKAEKLANDIRLAEAAMVDFSRTNGVINPKAEEIFITKMLADLMSQIQTKKWDQEHSELKLLTDQLSISMRKLDENRRVYTPQHPEVLDNLTNIVRLESQIRTLKASRNTLVGSRPEADPSTLRHEKAGTTTSQTLLIDDEVASMERDYADLTKKLAPLSEKGRQYAVLDAGIIALNGLQSKTAEKLILLNQYVKNAEGYFRISRPATPVDVDTRPPMKKAKGFGTKGAMAGLFLAAALVLLMELKDRTMKTVAEVERVTGLRVLASLGNLDKMTPGARDKWAFRAWTVIAGQLNTSANHGMVCGFISSGPGEGRSTWIKLLGEAATRRGLRVLTVATKPSGTDEAGAEAETVANEKSFTEAVEQAMAENLEAQLNQAAESDGEGGQILLTLSASALAFPAEVVNQFNSGNLPAAHIPLPGWVWNRERRQQWQLALSHWMAIDNLVLLVELPPASMPESLLLAENLPQIIWLADSGKASISDTKEQLDMMRHAKCHIVGAVLNHEPDPIIKL